MDMKILDHNYYNTINLVYPNVYVVMLYNDVVMLYYEYMIFAISIHYLILYQNSHNFHYMLNNNYY